MLLSNENVNWLTRHAHGGIFVACVPSDRSKPCGFAMETSSSLPWVTSHLGYMLKLEIVNKERKVSLECHISRLAAEGSVEDQDQSVGTSGDGSAPGAHFVVVRTITLAIDHCASACLISLHRCIDICSGISRPYALIQKKSSHSDTSFRYQCVGVHEFDHSLSTLHLESQAEFFVDTDLRRIHHRNVVLMDGPSFIWVDSTRKYLGCVCLESETENLAHVIRTDLNENEDKCLTGCDYNLLGWSAVKNCSYKQILVLGTISKKVANKKADKSFLTSDNPETNFFAVLYEWAGTAFTQYRLRREDVSRVIPHEYSSVVRSIVIVKVEITAAERQNGPGGDDVTLLSFSGRHIFACTSQKHLLEFVDGRLVRCVDIESGSISRMEVIHGHQLQPHLCLWSSDDRSVTGVSCEDLQVL